MSGLPGLFSELKRRNGFRVGAAYVVVAWLLVQVADILLGNFGAPEWVFRSFVALALLGFPLEKNRDAHYFQPPKNFRCQFCQLCAVRYKSGLSR